MQLTDPNSLLNNINGEINRLDGLIRNVKV